MRKQIKINFYLFCSLLIFALNTHGQDDIPTDSANIQQTRKERLAYNKEQRKHERDNFKQHFLIGVGVASANVNSSVRFEEPNGIFSAKIDLESHLGLDNNRFIFSGNFIYRITPRSGLYAFYYQVHRGNNYELRKDIVFLDDTLKIGTSAHSFQNTNVFSFGYAFSILREEYAYLGLYFNVYFTLVNAGVRIDDIKYNRSVSILTPMPSLGLLASFELTEWLRLAGGFGAMYLNTYDLGGSLLSAKVYVEFMPVKWLGISLGYYVLDVELDVPVERFRAYLNYKLNGPKVGLWFRF